MGSVIWRRWRGGGLRRWSWHSVLNISQIGDSGGALGIFILDKMKNILNCIAVVFESPYIVRIA